MANANDQQPANETTEVKTYKQGDADVSNADILAGLCIDAEAVSVDIRNCIRLYDEKSTTSQLTNLFKQVSKETLGLTLDFLCAQTPIAEKTWSDYLKPTCIRELIVRIQNLLIDTCGFCKENYASQRTDKCYLKCCYCGQFAHEQCLRNILGDSFNENMNEKEVHGIIFPFNLNCFYFCHECSDKQVPQNTTGLKKMATKPKAPQTLPIPPQNEHTIHGGLLNAEGVDNDVNNNEKYTVEDNLKKGKQINSENTGMKQKKVICHFYRKGICKYGRKGEGCKFDHPPYCRKLLDFGTDHHQGCKMSSCKFYHPKMCYKSLRQHECFNIKCPYFHVKGTKRVPLKEYGSQNRNRNMSYAPNQTSLADNEHANTLNQNSSTEEYFLKMFQQMKFDLLKTLENRIPQMAEISKAQYIHPVPYQQVPLQQGYLPQNQTANQNAWMTHPQQNQFPSLQN